jgi:hypothetical protein
MSRYSNIRRHLKHGFLLHAVLQRLKRFGFECRPYIIYRERVDVPESSVLQGYAVERITPNNVDRIMDEFPEKHFVPRQWRQRVAGADIGLTVRAGDQLIGYSWAHLSHCVFKHKLFPLTNTQAHVMDTYVTTRHRGKGIAPALRQRMIKELSKVNRTEIYSISEFFNTPARNYKRTLRAAPLELRLCAGLFSRWSIDVRLRSYAQPLPTKRWVRAARSRNRIASSQQKG